MYKWKQERQDRIEEDRRHNGNARVAMKEHSDTSPERRCFGDVVVSAFREIEESLDGKEGRVWIHVEANRTWLTIGCAAEAGDEKEGGKRLKYQVEVTGQTMKSRLYQLMSAEPQKECSIGDEREIAGGTRGKDIADITSKDIIDDFMATLAGHANQKKKS